MSLYIKTLIMIICINLMLVYSGMIPTDTPTTQGNAVKSFFSLTTNNLSKATIDPTFQNTLSDLPKQASGTSTAFGIIDGIKLVLDLVKFIFATVTAPFQLLFNPLVQIPPVMRVFFGIPYTIIYIFAIVGFARGNE